MEKTEKKGATILQFIDPNKNTDEQRMTKLNLVSLKHLTDYVSYNIEMSERSIEEMVSKRFGANNYEELPARYFDQIVIMLVDFADEFDVLFKSEDMPPAINKLPI
jgi:hypothetical protein